MGAPKYKRYFRLSTASYQLSTHGLLGGSYPVQDHRGLVLKKHLPFDSKSSPGFTYEQQIVLFVLFFLITTYLVKLTSALISELGSLLRLVPD